MKTPSPTIQPGADRRIRAAAAHRGLTLIALADAVREAHPNVKGVGPSNIKILGGTLDVRTDQLEAIGDVCGVPLWYLTGGFDALNAAHDLDTLSTGAAGLLTEVRELRKLVVALLERNES